MASTWTGFLLLKPDATSLLTLKVDPGARFAAVWEPSEARNQSVRDHYRKSTGDVVLRGKAKFIPRLSFSRSVASGKSFKMLVVSWVWVQSRPEPSLRAVLHKSLLRSSRPAAALSSLNSEVTF